MQLTALQKSAAQAIVNIFETGSIRGDYGDVTLLPGDSGQLTYGRSQTTLASGNLYLLIQDYCGQSGSELGSAFKPYLPKLEACDLSLNNDVAFRSLLEDAGDDPVMQDVQDAFFDRVYWDPAMRSADALGAQTALGAAIVYDSTVHGSWAHVRDLTRKQYGELQAVGEQKWMSDYVATRRDWLATYPNPLLHKTVYRMDAFQLLINAGNWKLGLPFAVRGQTITQEALTNPVPVNVPAESTPRRVLRLKSPAMTGPDVSWLQERLTLAGVRVAESGTFDDATDAAVRTFQQSHDLKTDGVVGSATRSALEDIPLVALPSTAAAQTPLSTKPMPAVPQPKLVTLPATVTPVAPTGDAVTDIKQHVSNEVSAGVAVVQKTIKDSHQETVALVAPHAAPQKKAAPVVAQDLRSLLTSFNLSSRPALAALFSVIILLFTELRDAIGWVAAGLTKAGVPLAALPPFPNLPQSWTDAPQFLMALWAYLHMIAGSLPNEWVFRIRILAIVLIIYALYRMRSAHVSLNKLQESIAAAKGDISQVTQDASVAGQVAQDVASVARTLK